MDSDWQQWVAFGIFLGLAVGLGLLLRFGANRLIACYGQPEKFDRPSRAVSIIVGLAIWMGSVAVLAPALDARGIQPFWAAFIALVPTWIVQGRIENWTLQRWQRRRATPRSY
jgi:hypothetical protein